MALIGISGVSRYGFYVPIGILRLYELHLILEATHPVVHHELLLFLPLECSSINIYLHGKKERLHGSFLHNFLEQIYDESIDKNGVVNFTKTFLHSTHINNYMAYESSKYKSVKLLQTVDDFTRKVLIDGLESDIYLDLSVKVIDFGKSVKLEIFRKSRKKFEAGITALRISTLVSNPERVNPYKIHIFTPEILGEEYSLLDDEKQAISNSFLLNLIDKEEGLTGIKNILNKGIEHIKEIIKEANIEDDIHKIIYDVNIQFSTIKKEISNYFAESSDQSKPHSDVWLQVPEFVSCRDLSRRAKEENYSWDFVFNVKPIKSLISDYFLHSTRTYHLYISILSQNRILTSPTNGGAIGEFEIDFGLEPTLIWVMIYPFYSLIARILRFLDYIPSKVCSGFEPYNSLKKSLVSFNKINKLRFNLFLSEIYEKAFNSQNIVNIFLLVATLLFTLSSIIVGTQSKIESLTSLSLISYFQKVLIALKSPLIYVPTFISFISLLMMYLYSAYRKVKRKWE